MIKDIHIIEIQSRDKKSSYAKEILEMLPKWFGNKQALDEYVEKVKNLPFFAAFNDADQCIGNNNREKGQIPERTDDTQQDGQNYEN